MERRETLVAAILMAILVTAWCLAIAWRLGPPPEAVPAGTEYVGHVVGMGDTLWAIAQRYRPDEDPRKVIQEIQQDNDIGPIIRPGDIIRVRKPFEKQKRGSGKALARQR
mgnify:CR=1 FL=1